MKHLNNSIPFLYVEHGTIYRKDSNIVFQNNQEITQLPLDSFIVLLVGIGVNLSSNALSHIAKNDCFVAISSADQCPKVFLTTFSSMGNPEYTYNQIHLHSNRNKKLEIAKKLTCIRFGSDSFNNQKSTNELMLAEARATKKIYKDLFGKDFTRNFNRDSDHINKLMNICNNALYNYCGAIVHLMGLSPHIGFLHGRTRNALILDLSEIFKTKEYYSLFSQELDIKDCLNKVSKYFYNNHNKLMRFIEDVFSQNNE